MEENTIVKNKKKSSQCLGCALIDADICDNSLSVSTSILPVVDILVVGSNPMPDDIRKGCFMSRGGHLIRSIITKHLFYIYSPQQIYPKIAYTYAVRCCPEQQNFKVSIDTINQCSRTKLLQHIAILKPKVIVTLGIQAAKAVGIKDPIGSIRGKSFKSNIGGDDYVVCPTFHPAEIYKKPGKLPLLRGDIHRAIYKAVNKELYTHNHDIKIPVTANEIVKELDRIHDECVATYEQTKKKTVIAIDTETTSLIPWDPASRMIMISLSHKDNYGLAFPWEHRDCIFQKEEFDDIKKSFNKLVQCPAIEFTGHNIKFDSKWLGPKYGLNLKPFFWDSMLGEHLLWEEKTGFYSLKSLVVEYFPEYAAYEKELKNILKAKLKEKQDIASQEYKEKVLKYKEDLSSYFIQLDESNRNSLVNNLVSKGVLTLDQGTILYTPEYKKSKKEEKELSKKYLNKIKILLSKLPDGSLDQLGLEKPERAKNIKITFEEVDLYVLLKYAALDALCSRKLMALQVASFKDDTEVIQEAQKTVDLRFRTKFKILTKSLNWCMQNIVMPSSEVLMEMEYYGVRLDQQKIKDYHDLLTDKLSDSEKILWEQSGKKFNINANADLIQILYKELGYPIIKKSDKTGEPSVDADTLEELNNIKKNPFLTSLLSHRKMAKCRKTYLASWIQKGKLDNRIHTQYNQSGTATGRLSSSDPNL